jgi:hypothetical protein
MGEQHYVAPQEKNVTQASDAQNAAAVGAGAAALGAVVALTLSTTAAAPIVGAIALGALGVVGGSQANNIVKWWRRDDHVPHNQ